MKTTVDLPDLLVFRAKQAALSRKTTLRELIACGLEREIQSPSGERPPWEALLGLDPEPWKKVDADTYVADLRKDWM
jgi:hypothetical protein